MALFENVTYDFYSDVLGRAIIPDAETFEKLKLLNVQKMKCLLPYLEEREENGIDSAVCMMMEIDYRNETASSGAGGSSASGSVISSESVNGHSVSFDNAARIKELELDAKGTEERKLDVIKLFCYLNVGMN